MVGKSNEAMRTIGEVAESLDLPQHVLRFWETRFKEIDPLKRAGGRRFYRQRDIELVSAIRHLLYNEGYTIKGVQRILKERGVDAVLADVARRLSGADPTAPVELPDAETQADSEATQIDIETREEAIAVDTPAAAPAPTGAPPVSVGAGACDLRRALAEIEECKRLLNLTRR